MQLSDKKFKDLPIHDLLKKGVDECGFEKLTTVQAQSLPETLEGKDLAVQAQTGSGKTAAFLLTIFNHLLNNPARKTKGVCPRAIVITPTRELTVQVAKDAEEIGKHLDLRILSAFGGVDYHKQRDAIRGGVDLLVGTPGRLIDYLKQKVYHLRDVEIAVIDEADRMFDMGFISDIRFMLKRMSPYDKRQSMLFSATLSDRVMELSYEYMNVPGLVEITPEKVTAEKVEQHLYHVGSHEKFNLLLGLLKREEWSKAIMFINTKRQANKLKAHLDANDYPAAILSGDVDQVRRLKVLKRFISGDVRILVATDVASRGLHVDNISHVFNYDLPQDAEDYVHRIGRTARAGAEGKAFSLACEDYVYSLPEIEDYIGHPIDVAEITEDLLIEGIKPPPKPKKKHHDRKKHGGRRSGGGKRREHGDKKKGSSSKDRKKHHKKSDKKK